MANPWWADFYKVFSGAFRKDPLWDKTHADLIGAGETSPDMMDVRGDMAGVGQIRLRDTNDLVDTSSISNRPGRYKEYERLRILPEIENSITTIADETCVAGHTKIATAFYGLKTIKWIVENLKEPFLVYCYDFSKKDYTLGWAYDPRYVKTIPTVRVLLDDGTELECTTDHRILKRDGSWIFAKDLNHGDELMPFYKIEPNKMLNDIKIKQFPRIFTFKDGWKHERQFIDEWNTGKVAPEKEKINTFFRYILAGLGSSKAALLLKTAYAQLTKMLKNEGFTLDEIRWLSKKPDRKRVVGLMEGSLKDVYDLSVKEHENFCTESLVVHNCQKDENGNVFKIICKNEAVQKELNFLFFNRKMLNMNRKIWNITKKVAIQGDEFVEIIINKNNPKDGILKIQELPCDTMYRIETTKGKLVEFQQSRLMGSGPDYAAVMKTDINSATEEDLLQSTCIRFNPNQIVHFKIGDERKTFYPYGVSLIEPARGPAHQLRLLEDAMVTYRLSRAPERRIFYIDTHDLPAYKGEALIERMKDQFRKKKVMRSNATNNNSVEERWHAPAVDEDYWLPIRKDSNTRIETLPGAQNLSEIDDALYFRKKLFIALNFPINYYDAQDINVTKITISAQDCKFSRMIERIQSHLVDGILEIAERHLELMGYPAEVYEDLQIIMTPPSHYKEASEAEIINQRISVMGQLKSSLLMADYDILTKWGKYTEEEAQEIISRNNLQKYQDAKLQILMANPGLMGVGQPGQDENELGADPNGPNPMLSPDQQGQTPDQGQNPDGQNPDGQMPPDQGQNPDGQMPPDQQGQAPEKKQGIPLGNPTPEEVKLYDLEIQGYAKEQDYEEPNED
jgi:hypothetical protein